MRFACIGINYKETSVESRERFAVARDDMQSFLQALCGESAIQEAFVLSTCNRTEIYVVAAQAAGQAEIRDAVHRVSTEERGNSLAHVPGAYLLWGTEAILHLFMVASSLDSMVVGEPQILGQVKDAWREAQEADVAGAFMHRVVNRALKTAKRVRTETEIASGAVSVSFVAVQLARRIFADIAGCSVLVLGAGEMAELTALHLHENGVSSVSVANRNLPRARELADRYGWKAETLEKVPELLVDADIVVASTGSPRPVLGAGAVKAALASRHYRPLFLVDIALPRDIEAAAGDLDGVYLYNVDDLEEMASQNRVERQQEMEAALQVVHGEVESFTRWLSTFSVTPTIAALRKKLMDIRADETTRSQGILKTLTPEQLNGVERMTMSMVNKILHGPASAMKNGAESGGAEEMVSAIEEAFELRELGVIEGESGVLEFPGNSVQKTGEDDEETESSSIQ